jgi:amino acid transporter
VRPNSVLKQGTNGEASKLGALTRRLGSSGKMRLLPLIAATYYMVSGGPYGLEDIIGKAGYGRALLLLVLVPLFWSLPTSLMVGELASAMPCEGGYYHWVRRAMGPFWGFQEAWLSLAASVFDMAIYPTAFVLYLSHIAPALTAGARGFLLKLAIVAICALWNLRGAVSVGQGSERMMAVSLAPFLVLVALAIWNSVRHGFSVAAGGPPEQVDLSGAVLVAMWNYMGWDNASTIAQEVEYPQRNYPRAMVSSAVVVMFVYILPLAAVWLAGIPAGRFSTGAWVDAAILIGGPALALAVVLAGSIDGLGTFNALTLSYTRLPYAMAEDGLLPRVLAKRRENGVPWVSVLLCSLGWALALTFTFERLITVDLVLYGAALVLEFVALVVLRVREPEMKRPFRVPGGLGVAVAIGAGPTLLIAFALWAARGERVAGLPALIFATIVALAGPVVYLLTARHHAGIQTRIFENR